MSCDEMVIGSKDQCIILNVKHQTQRCWAQISQTPCHLHCSTTALFNSAFHMLLKLSKSWTNWKCLLNSNQAVTYPACAQMRLRVNLKCLLHFVCACICRFVLSHCVGLPKAYPWSFCLKLNVWNVFLGTQKGKFWGMFILFSWQKGQKHHNKSTIKVIL